MCAVMTTYEVTAVVITTNSIERFPAYMVTDQEPYVNGGLIFTFPTGLFTSPPTISATIETPLHASTITYTAEICTETINFAEIMVYENNSGVLSEAGTGTVTVHFTATGT